MVVDLSTKGLFKTYAHRSRASSAHQQPMGKLLAKTCSENYSNGVHRFVFGAPMNTLGTISRELLSENHAEGVHWCTNGESQCTDSTPWNIPSSFKIQIAPSRTT